MNVKNIILNKRNQIQNETCHLYEGQEPKNPNYGETMVTEIRVVAAWWKGLWGTGRAGRWG